MKSRILKGETISLFDIDDNMISVWFQPKTNNFCLELNARVIKATKTFKPIQDRLDKFRGLIEDVTV